MHLIQKGFPVWDSVPVNFKFITLNHSSIEKFTGKCCDGIIKCSEERFYENAYPWDDDCFTQKRKRNDPVRTGRKNERH